MRCLLAILFMGIGAVHALATCIALNVTLWTPEQRGFLSHVAALEAGDIITMHPLTETIVEICAPTADISGLISATLQGAAQTIVEAHAAAETARQAARTTAQTEVQTNTLCTATFAEAESRLDAQHAVIQAAIDAIDATDTVVKLKTAMTTENTRRTAIDKQLAKCVLGRATLQGN